MINELNTSRNKSNNALNKALFLVDKFLAVFITLLVAAIFAGGYFLFIAPKLLAIEEVKINKETADGELRAADIKLSSAKKLLDAFDEINAEDKEKVNKMLPRSDEFKRNEIFGKIEALIRRNGLILDSVNVSESVEGEQASPVLKLSISVSGLNYEGLKNLLADFESNIWTMNVQSISYKAETSATFAVTMPYLE